MHARICECFHCHLSLRCTRPALTLCRSSSAHTSSGCSWLLSKACMAAAAPAPPAPPAPPASRMASANTPGT